MNKKTLHVAVSSQKGGGGKTTITVLLASYFHYVLKYNVGIADCDYPQHSVIEMRKRDLELFKSDEFYKVMAYDQLQRINKKGYKVIETTPQKALNDTKSLQDDDLDFIFYDLPGTVDREGVIYTLAHMDYILSPISADRNVLESTLRFCITLNDELIKKGISNIKGMYLFWNLVDNREKTQLYDAYEKVIAGLGLKTLSTSLPDSKRFRREASPEHRPLFRSTLFPPDRTLLKGSNIDTLCNELLEILK